MIRVKHETVDSRRHLALFVPSLRGGGAQRVMLALARGFAEQGHTTDLLLARAEGPFLAELPRSVHLLDLDAQRVLCALPRLVTYLRRERPEVMVSALEHANVVALWAKRLARVSTRVVVTQHNALSVSAGRWADRRGHLLPSLVKRSYHWADAIVAVSNGVADDLAQLMQVPRGRIRVIYNPVVTPDLREKAQAPLEHPWFGPGAPPVLLGVGRLSPQKDFSTLIQAFAQVRKERRTRLLILGEGPERPRLEAMVTRLGLEQDVGLPGFVENPYPYMTRAALFVLSSRWEGLGIVLVEALYCGALLVATDCPHGPREILEHGRYGRLVPVGDIGALAQAIDFALCGEAQPPPSESWCRFERETVVRQYLSILFPS